MGIHTQRWNTYVHNKLVQGKWLLASNLPRNRGKFTMDVTPKSGYKAFRVKETDYRHSSHSPNPISPSIGQIVQQKIL